MITLEEINAIADSEERLRLLKKYIEQKLADALVFERSEPASDSDAGTLRDEAGGMMSRFGKPDDR